MEDVVLYFHIFGVLLFVAGIVVAGVGFESGRRRERPDEIALLLGLARTGALLVTLGALLLLVCGLWLTGLEDDIDYSTGWVQAAFVLFAVSLALGGWGGQRPKRARKLATELAGEGRPVSAELRRLLDDRTALAANYASGALVPVILALMVFKP